MPKCGNTKSYSNRKILHTHLLYKGFMPHYNVWTRHGEIGVMMEDGEEEEDDDNYVPPEYSDAATGELLKIKRNQTMCPMMMISAGSLSKGEAEVRSQVRGSQKRVLPQLRRWQHKARYRTGIAAVEGRECCA